MQKQPDRIDRKMVPRWRSLGVTPAAELLSANRHAIPVKIIGVDELAHEWAISPTLELAADLIGASVLSGKTRITDEAARFLEQVDDELAPAVRHLLSAYNADESSVAQRFGSGIPSRKSDRFSSISSIKRNIRRYPGNPIQYVELARLYVSLGQTRSAEKAFAYALAIAPKNRYVLRSAVRFFVHEGQPDRAWSIVRDAPANDPWLIACRITTAELSKKPQEGLRTAKFVLQNQGAGQITELAASLATLELSAGAGKVAKKLFRQSAEKPNDNSVAQLRWANEKAGIPFDTKLLATELSFEARTAQAATDRQWESAAHNAEMWLTDEPFSIRAAHTGCFLASEMALDYALAAQMASTGLLATPDDPLLLNDYAFSLANLGQIEDALAATTRARARNPAETTMICLTATEGCIHFKVGNTIIGAEMYRDAVERAIDIGATELAQRGYLHWIQEELRVGHGFDSDTKTKLLSLFSEEKAVTPSVKDMFDLHVKDLLERTPATDEAAEATAKADKIIEKTHRLIGSPPPIFVRRPVQPAVNG